MIPDINLAKLGEYPVKNAIIKVKIKRRRGPAAAPFLLSETYSATHI
jgi:hypothetical protein